MQGRRLGTQAGVQRVPAAAYCCLQPRCQQWQQQQRSRACQRAAATAAASPAQPCKQAAAANKERLYRPTLWLTAAASRSLPRRSSWLSAERKPPRDSAPLRPKLNAAQRSEAAPAPSRSAAPSPSAASEPSPTWLLVAVATPPWLPFTGGTGTVISGGTAEQSGSGGGSGRRRRLGAAGGAARLCASLWSHSKLMSSLDPAGSSRTSREARAAANSLSSSLLMSRKAGAGPRPSMVRSRCGPGRWAAGNGRALQRPLAGELPAIAWWRVRLLRSVRVHVAGQKALLVSPASLAFA